MGFMVAQGQQQVTITPSSAGPTGDTMRTIHIIQGKSLRQRNIDSLTLVETIAGNAVLKEGLTIFYCDSAVVNHRTNIVEAFGNIHINDNDSIHTYAQYVKYVGSERIAYLKKNVKLTDKKGTLFTDDLEYNLRTGIGTYHLRPFGQPCIDGFFGGRFARQLEEAGDGAIAAQAIDEIAGFLGNDFRRRLKPLAESRWAHDPWARGSYSHALPGHAGDRAALAAPVDERLFFAGEATSPNFFSTAHGARDSGERAAREVLIALRGSPAS